MQFFNNIRLIPAFVALLFTGLLSPAQSCTDCRYASYIFDSVETSTVKFGEGENADGDLQELFMDIYTPYGDTASNRPLIIFAFGGGFVQGARDEGYVQRACTRFARAGYVAAAIDYRIGFDPFGLFPIPTEELMRVFFRAMQDMRGSIQWFRAHVDQMGNTFRIDDNKILIGGASAGAITACMSAYCDKSSEYAEIGDTNAIAGLGGFYSTSGTYDGYPYDVQGVFSIAGAVVNTDWIEAGDPPIFCAHGDQDLVVPYQGGNFGLGPISIGLEGSYNIDQACQGVGVCSVLFTMEGEGHPSGGESEEYFDQIFLRSLPIAKAGVENKSFCCPYTVEITPGDTVSASPAQTITLNVNVSGASNPQIQWCEAECGNSSNDATFEFIANELPGHVMVMVEENGCVAHDFIQMDLLPTSTASLLDAGTLEIYPNPTTDVLHLRSTRGDLLIESATLYNLSGQVAAHWNPADATEIALHENLPAAGVYLLQVQTNKGATWEKVMLR